MKRIAIFFLVLCLIQPAFAAKKSKKKEKSEPMVQTVEEWLESATSVKMDMREDLEDKFKEDEKYIPAKELPVYIEPYNTKAGSKELDLTLLHRTKTVRSPFVVDSKFDNAVYTETNYYSQTKQVASTVYLIEPDKYLSKKDRIEKLSVFEHTRYPLISTALPYLKDGFFSTLTVVDFSNDGKSLIVKEKRGSNKFGLYETYVWIYYLTNEQRESNECYMNNLDFAKSFNQIMEENTLESGFDVKDSESKNIDYNNLNETPNNDILKFKDLKTGTGEAVVENIEEAKKGMPKLSYSDLNSYITASLKKQQEKKVPKTRWYNNTPADFRVDTPYNEKEPKGFGVRLNLLNETIKAYWLDRKELFLNYIRWDLNPLGFSSINKDEIIVQAWGYNLNGDKISLGNWAVNIKDGLPRLMGDDETISVEANALYLQKKINPR